MITPGFRLGPYEVVAPLGRGGMGEVFRARDTRLERLVAIKVVSGDASSLAFERFAREARAVAALNHPNICAIYDLGSSPVPFVVMELLEGETLHQRLSRGPFDLATLLDVAVPLADALATVHSRNVIHRDLKPANIFLTAYGPKILDFGLARVATNGNDPLDASLRPTLPAEGPLTGAGVTVGTVAYMSPEQLRAESLDARSDVFSLGAVLYEMTTGRPAFAGSTSAVTSAAILHEPVVAPRQIRPDVPAALEEIILKALDKDRDLRTQSAAEMRAELTRLKRTLSDGRLQSDAGSAAVVVASAPASQRRVTVSAASSDARIVADVAGRHRLLVFGTAALVLTALLATFYVLSRRSDTPVEGGPAAPSLADLQVQQLGTSDTAAAPALSPDGRYVAYVERSPAGDSLKVMQTTATDTASVPVPVEAGMRIRGATFTHDSAFIYYVKQTPPAQSELWQVPLLGGRPRLVIPEIASLVSFSPDGRQMAFLRANAARSQLIVSAPDGTQERIVTTRQAPEAFLSLQIPLGLYVPAWSPDGRTLALLGRSAPNGMTGQVVLVDVATGATRVFPAGPPLVGSTVGWVDSGTLVVSMVDQSSAPLQLWVLSVLDGHFRHLTNDLNQYAAISLTTDRNQLVTTRESASLAIWVGDAAAQRLEPVVPAVAQKGPIGFSVAWAGDDLLYTTGNAGGKLGLARWRASTRTSEVFATAGGGVSVSRDGKTIVYFDYDEGQRIRVDGDGRNRVVFGNRGPVAVMTPDGRGALAVDPAGTGKIGIDRTDGSGSDVLPWTLRVRATNVALSSDGQTVALPSFEGQRPVTIVCDLATCSSKRTLPALDGFVHFTPDNSALAYTASLNSSNIWIQPLDGGAPRKLTNFPEDAVKVWDFAWSADGNRLAVGRATSVSNIVLFRGLNRQKP